MADAYWQEHEGKVRLYITAANLDARTAALVLGWMKHSWDICVERASNLAKMSDEFSGQIAVAIAAFLMALEEQDAEGKPEAP